MNKWFLLVCFLVHGLQEVSAVRLDDMTVSQAQQFDAPDTVSSPTSYENIQLGSDIANFRRFHVDGGANGNGSTSTSVQVAGGAMTLSFGYDDDVVGQFVIVSWTENDLSAIWANALDLTEFDAFQLEIGLVTQPVQLLMTLRDKDTFQSQFVSQEISQFGTYRFEFDDFDQIDFSQIDIINIRFAPLQSNQATASINIQNMMLINDDVIFANGFEG